MDMDMDMEWNGMDRYRTEQKGKESTMGEQKNV
jgi:hypothetical protein